MNTSLTHDTTTELQYVEAPLNYLSEETQKPAVYMYTPPPGVPSRSGQYIAHTLPIFNGRVLQDRLSLDQHGFQLIRRETRVKNFLRCPGGESDLLSRGRVPGEEIHRCGESHCFRS